MFDDVSAVSSKLPPPRTNHVGATLGWLRSLVISGVELLTAPGSFAVPARSHSWERTSDHTPLQKLRRIPSSEVTKGTQNELQVARTAQARSADHRTLIVVVFCGRPLLRVTVPGRAPPLGVPPMYLFLDEIPCHQPEPNAAQTTAILPVPAVGVRR